MASCLGVRRPCLKAWSLLMNFMAMIGLGALRGHAFRIEAYAPWPMVFDISRKGRLVGYGICCDPGGAGAILYY